jgi:hypothetical protein
MTVATEISRHEFPGAGSTGPFAFTDFQITDTSHLLVEQYSSTGIKTVLTITTHYTVSLNEDGTGSVTLVTALPVGETLKLISDPDLQQNTDLANQGPYFGEDVEDAIDKTVRMIQRLRDLYDESISDPSADATAAAASAAAAAASAASAAGTIGTSTTNLALGTGSKNFTTQAGLQFGVGTWVLAASDSAPSTKWMAGQVTGYSGTSLTVNMTLNVGSTSHADWTIYISGAPLTAGVLPSGGAVDTIPVKLSATDYDVGWIAPGKHTVDLLAAGMVEQSSDAPTAYTDELGVTNKVMVSGYSFPPGSDKSLQVKIPLPKGFDNSLPLNFRPYWTTDDVAGTGNVEWDFQALYLRDSDAQDSAWGTAVTVTDTFLTDDDLHIGAESGDVTPGGTFASQCMLVVRVTRTGSTDTYTQDAVLESIAMTLSYNKWRDN